MYEQIMYPRLRELLDEGAQLVEVLPPETAPRTRKRAKAQTRFSYARSAAESATGASIESLSGPPDGKGGTCTGTMAVEVPLEPGEAAVDSAPPNSDSFTGAQLP